MTDDIWQQYMEAILDERWATVAYLEEQLPTFTGEDEGFITQVPDDQRDCWSAAGAIEVG